jgi:hypothetical protein
VLAGLVSDVSGEGTQAVAEELANTGDDTDGRGARAERSKKGTVDARAPPSYVMSPNRLTIPIVNTKANAGEEDSARNCFFTSAVYFGVNCARS